jgi:hypothetical protein
MRKTSCTPADSVATLIAPWPLPRLNASQHSDLKSHGPQSFDTPNQINGLHARLTLRVCTTSDPPTMSRFSLQLQSKQQVPLPTRESTGSVCRPHPTGPASSSAGTFTMRRIFDHSPSYSGRSTTKATPAKLNASDDRSDSSSSHGSSRTPRRRGGSAEFLSLHTITRILAACPLRRYRCRA